MGAKQSQDSTVSELPPRPPGPHPVGVRGEMSEDLEGDGILVPPIFPSLLSSGPRETNGSGGNGGQRRSPAMSFFGRQGGDRSERPEDFSSRSFPGSGSREESSRESSNHHHRHHHHHHHHRHRHGNGSSSSNNGTQEERSHHHRRRHREHSERRGHDGSGSRRARRYLHAGGEGNEGQTESLNSLDLNWSLIALNERLRALQLRRESEENGDGGGEGGGSRSGRHHGSSRSHSHSRNQFYFVRPSNRSKH